MYSKDEIIDILRIIRDAELSAPRDMLNASVEELQRVCNGVGGASMSPKLRKLISGLYKYATATAAIHDWRYEHSDGTPKAQQVADKEFLENGLDELNYRFDWYNWKRWLGAIKHLLAYRALQKFGAGDWCIAFRNNVLQINK